MNNLIGYPLKDALEIIEEKDGKIVNIIKVKGTNKKFNNLDRPYIIRQQSDDGYITLYVSYF
jgi:hypothetical protein